MNKEELIQEIEKLNETLNYDTDISEISTILNKLTEKARK